MIVADTSAIMAILLGEHRGAAFLREIEEHCPALVSAGNAIELAIVSSRNARLFDAAMAFLKQPCVRIEPVAADQVAVAGTVGNPDNPGIEASDPTEDCGRAAAGEGTRRGPGGMAVPLGAANAD